VIEAAFITKILIAYFGAWAMGFCVGKSVAWVRAIGGVA
jgi:hypothetical protein